MAEPFRGEPVPTTGMTPRIVFAGTPEFAATILDAVITAGWQIPLVITQPPAPAGRGRKVRDSAVFEHARQAGLTVRTPAKITDLAADLKEIMPDVLLVAAYGQLIPAAIFGLPTHGTINVHASLLPQYRGASPVAAAVAAGDTQTGVSLMQIDAGLDTGPVFTTASIPIQPDDTTATLTDRLAALGSETITRELPRILSGELTAVPQDGSRASTAPQLTKADGRIDWSQPAVAIERHIRAMQPWPGAWTELAGTRLEVLGGQSSETPHGPAGAVSHDGRVGTGNGSLQLQTIKPAGKPAMPAADWCRNLPIDARFE